MESVAASKAPKPQRNLWKMLKIPPRGNALHEALDHGFRADIFSELTGLSGLGRESLAKALGFAPATLQRRMSSGRFTTEESDRLFRLIKLMSEATRLFEGDLDAARDWMNQPVKGLGGRRPVEMLATSAEADEVFALIGRLEHGVLA